MSIIERVRCKAVTLRHNQNTQCKHVTTRGQYCHQHLNTLEQKRITKTNTVPTSKYGLIILKEIEKGETVAEFGGSVINAEKAAELPKTQHLLKIDENKYLAPS